jgi:hypothetical protein
MVKFFVDGLELGVGDVGVDLGGGDVGVAEQAWTLRISAPFMSRSVAKLWRKCGA